MGSPSQALRKWGVGHPGGTTALPQSHWGPRPLLSFCWVARVIAENLACAFQSWHHQIATVHSRQDEGQGEARGTGPTTRSEPSPGAVAGAGRPGPSRGHTLGREDAGARCHSGQHQSGWRKRQTDMGCTRGSAARVIDNVSCEKRQ